MKKLSICRFLLAILMLVAFTILPGCGQSDEIEIKLPQAAEIKGMVYVGGSVTVPGYYPVRDTDTLKSLIRAAGGASPAADLTQMRLYIPAAGEAAKSQKVDLNRAEAWLLEGLPDIGAVTAKRIVAFREQNGLFRSLNDLLRVEGIGVATLDKIKDLITVSE